MVDVWFLHIPLSTMSPRYLPCPSVDKGVWREGPYRCPLSAPPSRACARQYGGCLMWLTQSSEHDCRCQSLCSSGGFGFLLTEVGDKTLREESRRGSGTDKQLLKMMDRKRTEGLFVGCTTPKKAGNKCVVVSSTHVNVFQDILNYIVRMNSLGFRCTSQSLWNPDDQLLFLRLKRKEQQSKRPLRFFFFIFCLILFLFLFDDQLSSTWPTHFPHIGPRCRGSLSTIHILKYYSLSI